MGRAENGGNVYRMWIDECAAMGPTVGRKRTYGVDLRTYHGRFSWRCAAGCGRPIVLGDEVAETSGDLRPAQLVHQSCLFVPPTAIFGPPPALTFNETPRKTVPMRLPWVGDPAQLKPLAFSL